jgi:spore coat polysaccharide biosynthesis protein SpsF (cytidylyltransferase family)
LPRKPDPIFAAIERHRQAWETLKSAPLDDDQVRLREAVLGTESEVVNIRPTTTAGAVALRAYHREHRHRERMYPAPNPGEYSNWGKG